MSSFHNLYVLAKNQTGQLESILTTIQEHGFVIEHYDYQEQVLEKSLHIQLKLVGQKAMQSLKDYLIEQDFIVSVDTLNKSKLAHCLS